MSYILSESKVKNSLQTNLINFSKYLDGQWWKLGVVLIAVFINTGSGILTPYLISYAIDNYIKNADLKGLASLIWILILTYLITVFATYFQARIMGTLSQSTLYKLRNDLFAKIQSLPIAFFNQNKSGDLISRINNDTDKVNTFLSQSLLQSISNFFSFIGIGIFIFFLNWQMTLVTLLSLIPVFLVTRIISPWVEKVNKKSLSSTGDLSAQVQESLSNFKAVVAFNKQDYFQEKFAETNDENYHTNILAQVASGVFNPLYSFAGNLSQILILIAGIYFIKNGQLTVGLLVGFIAYSQKFYQPLRILGSVWGSLQSALAAWSRIQDIFKVTNNLTVIKTK